MEEFVEGRVGVAFKNEKFYSFEKRQVTVVRTWDQPAAWRKTKAQPQWQRCRPDIDVTCRETRMRRDIYRRMCRHSAPDVLQGQLLLPGMEPEPQMKSLAWAEAQLAASEAAFGAIPGDVRTAVGQFRERQFSLLSFCARCPGGLELLASTPALALMLANCWVFGRKLARPLRSVRVQLRKRQRDQLAWLGFAGAGERDVRILRKIAPGSCTVLMLLYLRQAMAGEDLCKRLSHLPAIHPGVVRIVSDPAVSAIATSSLLRDVALSAKEAERPGAVWQLHALRYFDENVAARKTVRRVSSLGQLEEYCKAIEDVRWSEMRHVRFPEPPLTGVAEIIPLCTPEMVACEGLAQAHCIENYMYDVAQGKAFAYKIETATERATVMIQRHKSRSRAMWVVSQCRGKANAPVSESVRKLVLDWAKQSQPDIKSRRSAFAQHNAFGDFDDEYGFDDGLPGEPDALAGHAAPADFDENDVPF
ncbi:MAG: PcfJ domain-containing protein [Candidatus Hydrogenedentes bacterium]|nr:PcfJ domain-containing protein [Candidatus Hydrogenedentota bacterium]